VQYLHFDQAPLGIRLCFVRIPVFVEQGLYDIPVNWRRLRQRVFSQSQFRSAMLSHAEIERVNAFKAFKKQVEWIAGRLAIKMLVSPAAPQSIEVDYEALGAPYLGRYPHRPISISHSQDYAVAGIGAANSGPIGLDIEKIDPTSLNAMQRIAFSDRECEAIRGRSPDDSFIIWTAKEAYLKYIKQGFHAGLKTIEILNGQIYHEQRRITGLKLTTRRVFNDYLLSVVCAHGRSGASLNPF
jgi:4'-phosphopantetheinyl transferase